MNEFVKYTTFCLTTPFTSSLKIEANKFLSSEKLPYGYDNFSNIPIYKIIVVFCVMNYKNVFDHLVPAITGLRIRCFKKLF